MREPRHLTTLWVFTTCYRDSFTFFLPLDRRLCGPQGRSARYGEEEHLFLAGNWTPGIQPAAHRYTPELCRLLGFQSNRNSFRQLIRRRNGEAFWLLFPWRSASVYTYKAVIDHWLLGGFILRAVLIEISLRFYVYSRVMKCSSVP
jgi:hypothetical protein